MGAVGQVDQAGHQPFQPLARAETAAAVDKAVAMQQRQQGLHRSGLHGEVELHFVAALVFGQRGQRAAFGQGDGEGVADQRQQRGHAVGDVGLLVAGLAQRLRDHRVLPGRCGIAGAPAAPGAEVGVFQRGVHHHAEARAGKALVRWRVVRCLDGRLGGCRIGGRGFVLATRVGLGRRGHRVAAALGPRQLGEAVYPPVRRNAAGDATRRCHAALVFGRQARWRSFGHAFDDADVGLRMQGVHVGQQRCKPAFGDIGHVAGGNPQRMLGAGEADVEQARVLGLLLALERLAGVLPVLRILVDAPVQRALAGLGIVDHAATPGLRRAGAQAGKRQVHQRVFQALALVQGDDLHAVRVRFQPQQLRLVALVGTGHLRGQPVDLAVQAERARVCLLQQLAQLQVVGQAALAVEQAEQAFGLLRAHLGEQRERAVVLPALAPDQALALISALRLAIGVQCGDGGGIQPQQHGGQRGAQAAAVGGLVQGQQQRAQFGGLVGGEQALLAGRHRRHAGTGQRLLHARGLLVVAHQHGDVARPHRRAVDQRTAGARIGQHAVDVRHAGGGGGLARGIGLERRAVAAAQQAQGERGGRHAIAQVVGIVALGARQHRLEGDARLREGILATALRTVVQGLDGAQHGRARAEIVVQPRRDARHRLGRQIGGHVAAAEAVDGLLGIAYQGQQVRAGFGILACRIGCACGRAEHLVEDAPLAGIGVLEFVHQRHPILRPQARGQGRAAFAGQCIGHVRDQVVVGLHAARALEGGQPRAAFLAQVVQQARGSGLAPTVMAFAHGQPVGNHRLQGRHRGLAGEVLLRALGQRFAGELVELFAEGDGRVRMAAPAVQFALQGLHPVGLVGIPVEHAGVDGGQHLRKIRIAVDGHRLGQPRGGRRQVRRLRSSGGVIACGPQRQHIAQLRHVLGQRIRAGPQPGQGERIAGRARAVPPQVGGDLGHQRLVVGQQVGGGEALPGFQRVLAQHPRAETVDGEDGGEVGFLGSDAQPRGQLRGGFVHVVARQMGIDHRAGQRGLVAFVGRGRRARQRGGQRQPLADAPAQLLGSGLGVGDGQHLAHAQAVLDDQAGEQRGQGEGLAGAGAGLDQPRAAQRFAQVWLGGWVEGAHAASPSMASARALPVRNRS